MKSFVFGLILGLSAAHLSFAQSVTSRLDGSVRDQQSAPIPNVVVTVENKATGQTFKVATNDQGFWVLPSMAIGTYRVTAAADGFKKASLDNVKLDADTPATANLTLEIGAVSETVEVQGGAEVLQTASATVAAVLTGRQVSDLPIPSRNATDLVVVQPGAQTPAGPRNTTFNGLPQSTLNMTLDGLNIQDNLLKSSSGGAFYPVVYPRTDTIEEVSVTSAAGGAESLGEGAIQIKFITKSGTNTFHGGAFIQERNTAFDANYYFNNIQGLPRDRILLHQIGAHIGGPILKNRVFFFFNYEVFRFPQSWNAGSFQNGGQLLVLNNTAQNGIFTYKDTTGTVHAVNLYQLAAGANSGLPAGTRAFSTTPDPIIAGTLAQISKLTSSGGTFIDRVASNNDYNRKGFNFLTPGSHKIDFPTPKIDANITSKHHADGVFNINPYRLFPDGINGVIPIFPGTGTVLGSNVSAGQREYFWTATAGLRSAWSSRWTSEVRFGMGAGNVLFFNDVTPSLFAPWLGYAPLFNYVTNPYTASNFSRRNDPVRQLTYNVTWLRGRHLINMGGSYSQINEWLQSVNTQQIPRISFALQNTDPVNFGSTNIFTTGNFPNSSPTDRSNAGALYALLTGRVSSITRSVAAQEGSNQFGAFGAVDRLRQREYGLYIQDSWKMTPRLTLNYGFRLENQGPMLSLSGTYTRPGYAGLYGVSGAGNLFKPGTLSGSVPVYSLAGDTPGYSGTHFPSPTVGVAWTLPEIGGPLEWLLGKGGQSSVLRAGFSITTAREALNNMTGIWGNNQGKTLNTSVDPLNFPAQFGAPGSVLFRDPTLPVRAVQTTYPLPAIAGNSFNDFDPNLKSRYVESWNLGFQRTLTKDTVLEVRYVGNRSARAWTAINLNEVNIEGNGFLNEFQIAQNNLTIARQSSASSVNFGNAGLPGQKDIPIISTALGTSSDTATATLLLQGQAGNLANTIANNVTRMGRLTAAGYAANLFVVNPANYAAGSNLLTNQGGSTYNSMQIEVRRRFSAGLLLGASYVWSHSLATGNLLSLRNRDGYTAPSPFDVRDAIKLNWVYELPMGGNHRFLGGVHEGILRKAVEGWQISGVTRIQTGTPSQLLSGGRQTFNTADSGVVLHNLSTQQLQDMIHIRKDPSGLVYYLPKSLIDNSLAAFQLNTKTLDTTQPYIGPANTAGQFGNQVYVYGPWFQKLDISLVKHTRFKEHQDIELRAQALNVLNAANFFLVPNSAGNITVNSFFGQTANSFRDINSTNDPGSRVIEFVLRYSF